ncbi:MAG: hypothetical protein HYV09_25785 [Deltaproteobacteria bacterium]|nr:hypothetical protein [Deltaproteobacteria bacterium]
MTRRPQIPVVGERLLCDRCRLAHAKVTAVDPSNDDNKYEWEDRAFGYVLVKARRKCQDFGRPRWLTAGNLWKRKCGTCFRDGAS